MKYKEYSDSELMCLIKEENQEAKDILYDKYQYIVKIIIKKYIMASKKLNIEYSDLYQEALLGYSDAIKRYNEDIASLPTFITLCVDRRLQVVLKKAGSLKNKLMSDSLSLEHIYNEDQQPLKEILSDKNQNNPLNNLEIDEDYFDLLESIRQNLSKSEYEVFSLMVKHYNYIDIANILSKTPKQIDNTIQRIKNKIKLIIEER